MENRLKNKWLLRYTCAAAYKCSCPFTLEIRHESGSDAVSIWQTEQHAFHDVNSAAHLAQLRMHPNIEAMAVVMLDAGASPAVICTSLNNMALDPADPLKLGGTGTGQQHFGSSRYSVVSAQISALRKRWRRSKGEGITCDGHAIAAVVDKLRNAGAFVYYQPYKEGGRGTQDQPLVIVIQTEFQARMQAELGGEVMGMDGTYGTNNKG